MRYPEVRRDDTAETIHGQVVADPYRWLEDADSADTAAFVAAQNAFAAPHLEALPARERFREAVTGLLMQPTRGCPWHVAGRFFELQNDGTKNQDVLVTADSLDGLEGGRVLLDPNELSDDGTIALTAISVSPDAAHVAYGVSDGGSDWRTIRLRRVEDASNCGDVIEWTKWNPPVWVDSTSFIYWVYDAPSGDGLTDEMGAGRLMLHAVGTPLTTDVVLFQRADEPRLFARAWPRDDDWLVLSTDTGSSSGNDLAVRRHDEDALRQLVEGHEHEWSAEGIRGGELFVVTDQGASRYRLVAFDLDTGDMREVVGEHAEDVLLGAGLSSSGLILTYSHDASHRIQLAAFDGTLGDDVPIGAGVSVAELRASAEWPEWYVLTTSFVDRGARHVVTADQGRLVSHRVLPPVGPARIDARTTRISATSADGTEIPAFLIDAAPGTGPRPTLIWGYGGFNIPMNPAFRPILAAWVAAGGVLVVPNLRGGGEFGADWHKAGTVDQKQHVFDDLFAIAEQLFADGITTPEQLALHGRSNGGLLAGAALTQRPDLWAAVLPGVGVLDMLRYHRFTIGWAWASDYGDPDDADDFTHLLAYSPLHNVRETTYPPTLITTGDHDDRVVPAHSFKFAAELQRAQQASGVDAPVLLSIDTRAGHGMGKPRDAAALEYADQLAFAAHHTGLRP